MLNIKVEDQTIATEAKGTKEDILAETVLAGVNGAEFTDVPADVEQCIKALFAQETTMRYLLYDTYETGIELGELIYESDDIAEIREAAKLRKEETDGECELYVMERI